MKTRIIASMLIATVIAIVGCKRRAAPTRVTNQATVRERDRVRIIDEDAGTITEGPLVPAGDLHAPRFAFDAAVYHLPRATTPAAAAIARIVKGKHFTLTLSPPAKAPTGAFVAFAQPPIESYAPPSYDQLRYAGRDLDDAQKTALQSSKEVSLLHFGGPSSDAISLYREALEIAGALAATTGGLLYDDDTREMYTQEGWRALRDGWDDKTLPVRRHIVVHMYQDGELLRLVTLGMRKLGLPDVAVNQVSGHDGTTMGELVDLTCQTMLERGALARNGRLEVSTRAIKNAVERESLVKQSSDPSAAGTVTVRLTKGTRKEGDADNTLVELVFPGPANRLQERQNAMLSAVFGAKEDVARAAHDDPELLAARDRARVRVMRLKPMFADGRPELERLLVKGPFTTRTGGVEWMWVEAVRWQGDTISGILENDPFEVDDLKAGARVEVKESAIFDYLYYAADGGVEGNETGDILEAREAAQPR